MVGKIYSPRFSLKGWDFKIWLGNNAWVIKELVKIAGPGIIVWAGTQSPTLAIIVSGLSKLILDVLEFYVKEHTK